MATITTNHFPRGAWSPAPLYIFIHSTRSSIPDNPPEAELEATLNWFRNPNSGASAHVVIDWWGGEHEVVEPTYPAWHANTQWPGHNLQGLSIELTQPTNDHPFSPEQYEGAARVCKRWGQDYDIPMQHINDIPLVSRLAGTRGIIGHDESPQGRAWGKSDPGPEWDWAHFMGLLHEGETVEEPGDHDWIQDVRWTAIELVAAGDLDELAAMLSGLGFGLD